MPDFKVVVVDIPRPPGKSNRANLRLLEEFIANLPQVKLTPQSGSILTRAVSDRPTQISLMLSGRLFRLAHFGTRTGSPRGTGHRTVRLLSVRRSDHLGDSQSQRVIAPGTQGSAKIVPVEFNNFQDGLAASWELELISVATTVTR